MNRALALARSRVGRLVMGAIGIAIVVALVASAGTTEVMAALVRVAPWLSVIVVIEGVVVLLDALALHQLYRAPRPGLAQVLRVTSIGYAVAALAPAGRALAEGVKAAMLGPATSVARATLAAGRLQAMVLLSSSALSLAAAVPAFFVMAAPAAGWACLINGALVGGLGLGLLAAGKRLGMGGRLGRRWARAAAVGGELDALWAAEPLVPWSALFLQLAARGCLVVELAVLLAVLGDVDVARAILAGGLFLVGTSVGDLIPAQLGATEANFVLCAGILGLARGDAIALPLIVRFAQLAWAGVGLVVPLVWPRAEVA